MGGTTGKLTHMGVAPEVIFGTPVAASSYLKFNSESLTLSIEELVEASLNARRDEGESHEGLGSIGGDSVHEIHPAGLGILLRALLGAPVTINNTGSYTHVFTPLAGRNRTSGTATAGAGSTLTDSGASWTTDEYKGRWIHITSGTAAGDWRYISSNTATIITVSAAFSTTPDTTSKYEVMDGPEHCALPPYTIEMNRDMVGATPGFQFQGMSLNQLALTIGVGAKILSGTGSWLGKDVANIAITTPSLPTTDPFKWSELMIGIGVATSGTATGGTTSTLVKTAAGWTDNAYQNDIVLIVSGTGANQVRKISSNTTDTLNVTPNFLTAPDATSVFKIFNGNSLTEALTITINNGLVPVPTLNNTKRIAQILNDGFRVGTMSRTVIPEDVTDFATYFNGWTTREWLIYYNGNAIAGDHRYRLALHFPKVLFTAYPLVVPGPGRITLADGIKMKYDATAGYFCKAILDNNTSAY